MWEGVEALKSIARVLLSDVLPKTPSPSPPAAGHAHAGSLGYGTLGYLLWGQKFFATSLLSTPHLPALYRSIAEAFRWTSFSQRCGRGSPVGLELQARRARWGEGSNLGTCRGSKTVCYGERAMPSALLLELL